MSTITRPAAKRRARPHRSRTSRLAALATAAMGTAVLVELAAGSAQGYIQILVGAVALGAYAAAVRMWRRHDFESRLAVMR